VAALHSTSFIPSIFQLLILVSGDPCLSEGVKNRSRKLLRKRRWIFIYLFFGYLDELNGNDRHLKVDGLLKSK